MSFASEGSPMSPLVVHQPPSPSICPAVQSLRRGLSTNPGMQCGAYVGAVKEMVCWARVRRVRRESISSELIMCSRGMRSILLLPLVAICIETIYIYIYIWRIFVFMFFYVCCSDCVGACGNVCCVAAIVKDSVFLPWSVEVCCMFV